MPVSRCLTVWFTPWTIVAFNEGPRTVIFRNIEVTGWEMNRMLRINAASKPPMTPLSIWNKRHFSADLFPYAKSPRGIVDMKRMLVKKARYVRTRRRGLAGFKVGGWQKKNHKGSENSRVNKRNNWNSSAFRDNLRGPARFTFYSKYMHRIRVVYHLDFLYFFHIELEAVVLNRKCNFFDYIRFNNMIMTLINAPSSIVLNLK